MAEFINKEPYIVKTGDTIPLTKVIVSNFRTYRIDCNWTENGIEYGGSWYQEADNIEKAYNIWRELFWMDMFDPLYRHINSFTISEYSK